MISSSFRICDSTTDLLSRTPAGAVRVRFTVDPASPLPGVRAFMALRAARGLGEVSGLEPSEAAMQEDGFAGTVRLVQNGDWRLGQFSSLRAGVAALPPETSAAVVALVAGGLAPDAAHHVFTQVDRRQQRHLLARACAGR